MKYIVYETKNNINGKIYVGVHRCNKERTSDDYIGSGIALKGAIQKYGRENFSRRNLSEWNDERSAYSEEERIVNKDFVDRGDTYNIGIGGKGGWEGRRITQPGESNPHAKLTWELVAQIRASDKGPTELAKEYNVAKSQISRIKNNITWRT